jgi:hypothetical protein
MDIHQIITFILDILFQKMRIQNMPRLMKSFPSQNFQIKIKVHSASLEGHVYNPTVVTFFSTDVIYFVDVIMEMICSSYFYFLQSTTSQCTS